MKIHKNNAVKERDFLRAHLLQLQSNKIRNTTATKSRALACQYVKVKCSSGKWFLVRRNGRSSKVGGTVLRWFTRRLAYYNLGFYKAFFDNYIGCGWIQIVEWNKDSWHLFNMKDVKNQNFNDANKDVYDAVAEGLTAKYGTLEDGGYEKRSDPCLVWGYNLPSPGERLRGHGDGLDRHAYS